MIHSYPWYIADWRGSEAVLSMTLEERGLYRELLDHCWECGSVPNNEVVLRKIAQVTEREWNRAWPSVKGQFFEVDGRLHHPKVDERRPSLEAWHDNRREAGRKGGLSKRSSSASSSASSSGKAEVKPSASASASASPQVGESVRDFQVDDAVKRMISLHPKPANPTLVEHAIVGAIGRGAKIAALEACHAAWCELDNWTEKNGKFAPKLEIWVGDDGWRKWPKKPESQQSKTNPIFNPADYGIPS